jgi:hypothetical protein
MGYLDRPEETAASYLKDGFFKTGDLGSIDNEGFITIHDRIKEMIKVSLASCDVGFNKLTCDNLGARTCSGSSRARGSASRPSQS